MASFPGHKSLSGYHARRWAVVNNRDRDVWIILSLNRVQRLGQVFPTNCWNDTTDEGLTNDWGCGCAAVRQSLRLRIMMGGFSLIHSFPVFKNRFKFEYIFFGPRKQKHKRK